jgi:hypothetical protein
LIGKTDGSVADVVLQVEVTQGVEMDLDSKVQFQLQTPLLQAQTTPLLQDFGIQQVLADIRHYLQALVIPAVVQALIMEITVPGFKPS